VDNDDEISTPVGLMTLGTLVVLLVLGAWKLIDLTKWFIRWLLP
jgi:Sec-independent protein translocase protein TatA